MAAEWYIAHDVAHGVWFVTNSDHEKYGPFPDYAQAGAWLADELDRNKPEDPHNDRRARNAGQRAVEHEFAQVLMAADDAPPDTTVTTGNRLMEWLDED